MQIEKYIEDGRAWSVLVAPGIEPEFGIRLGPPDLSGMVSDQDLLKKLYMMLVDAGLYNAPQLLGKRGVLRRIFDALHLPPTDMRTLIWLYQRDYYGDTDG